MNTPEPKQNWEKTHHIISIFCALISVSISILLFSQLDKIIALLKLLSVGANLGTAIILLTLSLPVVVAICFVLILYHRLKRMNLSEPTPSKNAALSKWFKIAFLIMCIYTIITTLKQFSLL